MPADRERLQALEEAGADSAALMVNTEPEEEAVAQLERIAEAVL